MAQTMIPEVINGVQIANSAGQTQRGQSWKLSAGEWVSMNARVQTKSDAVSQRGLYSPSTHQADYIARRCVRLPLQTRSPASPTLMQSDH